MNFNFLKVSIPSRGFWFFEAIMIAGPTGSGKSSFNPLAGILVF